MEWAKQQHPSDFASKVVLLLLSDTAEGADHSGRLSEQRLADEACLTRSELSDTLRKLEAEGLVATEAVTEGSGHRATRFRLLIPARWRTWGTRPPKGGGNGDQPTAVYRLYDRSGALLYVGISDRPEVRFSEHERGKHWWRAVVTREITWHDSRRSAEAEEERAINSDAPAFNVRDVAGLRMAEQDARMAGRRYVVANRRLAIFEKTLARLRDGIAAGEFDDGRQISAEILGERCSVERVVAQQALERLCDVGVLAVRGENWERVRWGAE